MTKQSGFTLVELAIALMVIGLLIGGVLKGQELIENARITATIRQIKAYDAATMIFRNTYNALPGDIKRPNRIPNCTDDICTVVGNGNGRIGDATTDPNPEQEIHNFFPHLTKAGMIQGPVGGDQTQMDAAGDVLAPEVELFFPSLPITGVEMFKVMYTGMMFNVGNMYFFRWVPNRAADQIDAKIDDGSACIGDMYSRVAASCDENNPTINYSELGEIVGGEEHMIFLRAGF